LGQTSLPRTPSIIGKSPLQGPPSGGQLGLNQLIGTQMAGVSPFPRMVNTQQYVPQQTGLGGIQIPTG